MHVSGITSVDLNWFPLQLVVTAVLVAVGLLYVVKNTASKYFVVEDANFDSSSYAGNRSGSSMPGVIGTGGGDDCVVCGNFTTKHCSRCKIVRYCSTACQRSHWLSGHNAKCTSGKVNLQGSRSRSAVALVATRGTSKIQNQSPKTLFPYEDFVELFNWEKPGFPPCGLLNCGNSCFANVVLQCLTYTRPLVAYLLEKGHQSECRQNDWCFLCELQNHVARARQSMHAFSPINILSRLPNIGGNLGYGKQEDAHEFMRFAIDTMQSICLDEFGGEKSVHPSAQETTLIQHIFGGHLQSQVICTKCNNISDQFENMMDLTVEIQGDCSSLEECLDKFTDKEWLHGDNMYKCDGCNDYVLAWKRLTIRRAPNILTIALKRFQSGRFGKLNKRVTFPETLNLSPYMSSGGDGTDVYKLYAVVVHVDMLNASFFGHYICYTKDFSGNWYMIDDCKVCTADLDEVLSQGAYMLLYSRVSVRQSCLNVIEESSRKGQEALEVSQDMLPSCPKQPGEVFSAAETVESAQDSGSLRSYISPEEKASSFEGNSSSVAIDAQDVDMDHMVDLDACSSVSKDFEGNVDGYFDAGKNTSFVAHASKMVDGTKLLTKIFTGDSVEHCESSSVVCNIENGNGVKSGAPECVSFDSLINGDVASTQNHVNGKMDPASDVSLPTSSIGNEFHKMVSKNSPSKLEKADVGKGMPTPAATKDAVGNLDRTISSGAKLKPVFAPGFLGKRPRNQKMKQDKKAQDETSSLDLKLGTSHHNRGYINGEQKSDQEYMALPSLKKGDKACNVTRVGASEFLHLSNGVSGVAVIPDERIMDTNIKDDKSLVEEASSGASKLEQHTG